jgi:gluconate 5-dehydrogenase
MVSGVSLLAALALAFIGGFVDAAGYVGLYGLFTGSITAVLGRERVTAYSAAKGALHTLVRQWSTELSPHGVTINAIAPGYIQTELTQALWQDPEFDGWLRKRTPAGRWGQPQDLAAAVVFLASNEAGFVTGQVLVVDGGLTATM